jgi:hypothetical protein
VIALVRSKAQEIGRLMAQEFTKAGYRSTVRHLKSDNRGARVLAPRR